MYDNIIFDLYGTLIDIKTDEHGIETWRQMCSFYENYGIKYNPAGLRSKYLRQTERAERAMSKKKAKYPEIEIVDVFEQLGTKNGEAAPDGRRLAEAAAREFRRVSTEYIRLYDGVTDMLGKLKEAGKKLFILSNAQSVFTAPEIRSLGIEPYFDDISLSSDFGAMKPDATFYQDLMERNHLNPKRSIMVGNDYRCDTLAASKVGLHTCYMHSELSPDSDIVEAVTAEIVLPEVNMKMMLDSLMQQ